jgi:hypothetical protein
MKPEFTLGTKLLFTSQTHITEINLKKRNRIPNGQIFRHRR